MNTYKTWEVVKILMENPRLRFEAKINKKKSNMWIDTDGDLVMDDYPITDNEWLNAEWHLVETPVAWQAALQAWSEGKTIRCKCFDQDFGVEEYQLRKGVHTCVILSRKALLYGQWFIVPEEVEE